MNKWRNENFHAEKSFKWQSVSQSFYFKDRLTFFLLSLVSKEAISTFVIHFFVFYIRNGRRTSF